MKQIKIMIIRSFCILSDLGEIREWSEKYFHHEIIFAAWFQSHWARFGRVKLQIIDDFQEFQNSRESSSLVQFLENDVFLSSIKIVKPKA